MDFSELQQRWQVQAAPSAGSVSETASVLAEMRRLHRASRRRNWLVTLLLLLVLLVSFLVSQFLTEAPLPRFRSGACCFWPVYC